LQPLAIEQNSVGQVTGVRMVRTELGPADSQGRRRPQPVAGSEFVMPADAVVIAFGYQPNPPLWLQQHDVRLTDWGTVVASEQSEFAMQTTNPRIFAGGDMVRGADLVVTAIAQGRAAAQGIVDYLQR